MCAAAADKFGFLLFCLLLVLHGRETVGDEDDWLIHVSVPEGVFSYPKEIYRIKKGDFYTEDPEDFSTSGSPSSSGGFTNSTGKLSNCRVEYYQFHNNLRTSQTPQLFTVITLPSPTTTTTPIVTSSSSSTTNTTVMTSSTPHMSTVTSSVNYSTTTVKLMDDNVTASAHHTTTIMTSSSGDGPVDGSTTVESSIMTSQPPADSRYRRSTTDEDEDFVLVQMNDLDRETCDQYTLSLICDVDNSYGYGPDVRWVSVTVTDTNDHTPRFDPNSLISIIPTNVTVGTSILKLRASDPDIGLNGEFEFSSVSGSVRRKLANETEAVGRPNVPILFVLKTGDIISYEKLLDEMTIYMKVVVKDRVGRSNGNRETATATISVISNFPPNFPPNPPTPSHHRTGLPRWIVMLIAMFSGFFGLFGAFLLVTWIKRKGIMNVLNLRLNESNDVLLDNETHENDQI